MSTRRGSEPAIKYLSVDEMMLKIVEMRAARHRDATPIAQVPEVRPLLRFPEYVSHCEAWSAAEEETAAASPEAKPELPIRFEVPRRGDRVVSRKAAVRAQAPIQAGLERYAFAAATLGIAALILAGSALNLGKGKPTMLMMASTARNFVAGSEPWNEISSEDVLYDTPTPIEARRRARPKVSPVQLEKEVHEMLASNGFPDIGVSASHHGEVYLAGEVFSLGEAGSIMKVARLATHGGRVFFLHPEVRDPQGPAFLGTVPEHAPEVWGARIRRVIIGSPAYKAGIRAGDVIREFDHATIADAKDLEKAIAQHKPGERVTIRVWSDGSNRYRIARLAPLTQFALR